jgi:hypothetical protein
VSDETLAKELFLDALEHAPGERSAFVRAQCGGDEARVARVHALLAAHELADRRLSRAKLLLNHGDCLRRLGLADGEAGSTMDDVKERSRDRR